MIHDPTVEVTCDKECGESVYLEADYKYQDYSGRNGFYDFSDTAIEEKLTSGDIGWHIINGKHICDQCAIVL